MRKKTFALLSLLAVCGTAFSQANRPSTNARINPAKPTIYIGVECQNKNTIQLRLHNNTQWAIAVSTFSFYFDPHKIVTIKLSNGQTAFPLPNDKEISSLYYFVEKANARQDIKVPQIDYSDSFNQSWIASKESILFSVPREYLQEGLQIYIPFNYEWELNDQGIIHNQPVHKTFFRGVELFNSNEHVNCQQ